MNFYQNRILKHDSQVGLVFLSLILDFWRTSALTQTCQLGVSTQDEAYIFFPILM